MSSSIETQAPQKNQLYYIVSRYNMASGWLRRPGASEAGAQNMTHKNRAADRLSDFRTDRRMLLLSLFAVPVGAISAVVAKGMLWLIALITNLSFYHRFSVAAALPGQSHLGCWMVLVPVAGARSHRPDGALRIGQDPGPWDS